MSSIQPLADRIPREPFLATSIDTLIENVKGQLQIDPLLLHGDQMQTEHSEARIDVA